MFCDSQVKDFEFHCDFCDPERVPTDIQLMREDPEKFLETLDLQEEATGEGQGEGEVQETEEEAPQPRKRRSLKAQASRHTVKYRKKELGDEVARLKGYELDEAEKHLGTF